MKAKGFPLKFRGVLFGALLLALSSSGLHAGKTAAGRQLEKAAAAAVENKDVYYDEIFDGTGKVRSQYENILPIYRKKKKKELEKIRLQTLKDFSGDNAVSPLPRLITESDFARLQAAVAQRGLAWKKFLEDHYSGEKRYLKDNIIPAEAVNRALNRSGEIGFQGKIDPEFLKFLYGPDVIRDLNGDYRALEDNTNYLGLQGDLIQSRESILKRMPKYKKALKGQTVGDPRSFYKNLLSAYRAEMPDPKAPVIIFSQPPYPDQEDFRLQKIWEDLGVESITPFTKKKLAVREDGVYLKWKKKGKRKREKVGFIIFNAEFQDVDPKDSAARAQYYRDWGKISLEHPKWFSDRDYEKLKELMRPDAESGYIDYGAVEKFLKERYAFDEKTGTVPGLIEAIAKGKVLSSNSPGLEFINDKELYIYADDIVRYYLGEEPLLPNLETQSLYAKNAKGERVFNEELFRDLEKNLDDKVVKIVDGRGGDGVYVGRRMNEQQKRELLASLRPAAGEASVKGNPREVIVQKFSHLSVVGEDIIDQRQFAQIGLQHGSNTRYPEALLADTPATRGSSRFGDGRVNLSAGNAHEVANIVVKDPVPRARPGRQRTCPGRFAGFVQ